MSLIDLPSTIRLIADKDREKFLPDAIGCEVLNKIPLFLHYESAVYAIARSLCEEYQESSGYWTFAKTENGAPFLFFTTEKVVINNIYGDNPIELDGYLAGISISAQAYCLLLERFKGMIKDEKHDGFIDRYHELIDEGRNLAEQLGQASEFHNHVD